MNLLKPSSIEEYIVSLLQKRAFSGAELLGEIQKSRPGTTKQALYAALRKLRGMEIVVMHKKVISLSSIWVIKMTEFFQLAKHFYTKSVVTDQGFLNLDDGDRISYTFKNPSVADVFWGHAFDVLSEITPLTEPIYIYNPHEWFFLARRDSEKVLFDKITGTGKQILVIAGGATTLDKSISKDFDGKTSQYYPTNENLFEKRNYYLNIFDDFLIEAWIDETVAKKLDSFYETTKVWNSSAEASIKKIMTSEGKNKLTISRNKKRAEKFKIMFKKYFYIKQG